MQVKIFVRGTSGLRRRKPADLFHDLQTDVNTWLEANPNIVIEHAHQLSRPSFDWGQLAVAVWYVEAQSSSAVADQSGGHR